MAVERPTSLKKDTGWRMIGGHPVHIGSPADRAYVEKPFKDASEWMNVWTVGDEGHSINDLTTNTTREGNEVYQRLHHQLMNDPRLLEDVAQYGVRSGVQGYRFHQESKLGQSSGLESWMTNKEGAQEIADAKGEVGVPHRVLQQYLSASNVLMDFRRVPKDDPSGAGGIDELVVVHDPALQKKLAKVRSKLRREGKL